MHGSGPLLVDAVLHTGGHSCVHSSTVSFWVERRGEVLTDLAGRVLVMPHCPVLTHGHGMTTPC